MIELMDQLWGLGGKIEMLNNVASRGIKLVPDIRAMDRHHLFRIYERRTDTVATGHLVGELPPTTRVWYVV